MSKRWLTILASVLLLTSCGPSTPYRVTRNLPYGPESWQTYDFYEPVIETPGSSRPTLLVIHGGGYVTGDKVLIESVAEKFCLAGYGVVAINYTLADGTKAGMWPGQLADAKIALAHMRAAPRLKIRGHIQGFGISAGAHLVAALHLKGDLARAVGISGPWDMINVSNEPLDVSLRPLLGLPPEAPIPLQSRKDISPVSWVRPSADMLLIHATRDTVISFEHSIRFASALTAVGAKVKLISVDSSSHGTVWEDAFLSILAWLGTPGVSRRLYGLLR